MVTMLNALFVIPIFCIMAFSGVYYYMGKEDFELPAGNLTKISEMFDGQRYSRIYRHGTECGALKWISSEKPSGALEVSPEDFNRTLGTCTRNPLHQNPYKAHKIYPGTKWCGRGHRASNYSDLGSDKELDTCCRNHDHCPLVIHSRAVNYGVKNSRFYTSSHCSCDGRLYDCLRMANSRSSRVVGNIYFNVLRAECFQEFVDYSNETNKYIVRFIPNKRF